MADQFEIFWAAYKQNEGGYVNNPSDAGGETKYGISRRSYPQEDIKNLTEVRAQHLVRRDFWDKFGFGRLNTPIGAKVCDLAVNMGTRPEVRLLQQAACSLGKSVEIDGLLGAKTVDAANACDAAELLHALCIEAAGHYKEIAANHPQDAKFLKGWIARAYQDFGVHFPEHELAPIAPAAAQPLPQDAAPPGGGGGVVTPVPSATSGANFLHLLIGFFLGIGGLAATGANVDLSALIPLLVPQQYIPLLWETAQGACAVVTIASLVVAGTRTPDPNTKLGKVYKFVETVALVIGKAKQTGLPPGK
jgi:lysozyme family protein